MPSLVDIVHFVLHLDASLAAIVADYGVWTYALLFLIVFCETGLVVTPFLPGDSLLFAAGALAGIGALDPMLLFCPLTVAAIAGDNVNYLVGSIVGPEVFLKDRFRFISCQHLEKTQAFYARHGGKTLVLARFLPILRTFAPFVAGIARMSYPRFLSFSVGGGILWVGLFVGLGHFFGNLPVVKQNFTFVVFAIILVSVAPGIIEYLRSRRRAS